MKFPNPPIMVTFKQPVAGSFHEEALEAVERFKREFNLSARVAQKDTPKQHLVVELLDVTQVKAGDCCPYKRLGDGNVAITLKQTIDPVIFCDNQGEPLHAFRIRDHDRSPVVLAEFSVTRSAISIVVGTDENGQYTDTICIRKHELMLANAEGDVKVDVHIVWTGPVGNLPPCYSHFRWAIETALYNQQTVAWRQRYFVDDPELTPRPQDRQPKLSRRPARV